MSLFDSLGGILGGASNGLTSVLETLNPLVDQAADLYGNLQTLGGSSNVFAGFDPASLLPPPMPIAPLPPPAPTAVGGGAPAGLSSGAAVSSGVSGDFVVFGALALVVVLLVRK